MVKDIAGSIIMALPNATFRVKLDDNEIATAYISGKLKQVKTKILVGDRVLMKRMSPKVGRIIYKYKI
ncbi:MAG: translation initiation factor IF-1 [Candidatus Hodgkinia cicadicola]